MQLKYKKLQIPPAREQNDSPANLEYMKERLQQILESLLQEKQAWQKQQRKKTQLLQKDLLDRQLSIQQLAAENKQLQTELQAANHELEQTKAEMEQLRRKNEALERSKLSTNNIIAYLQSKNKELNYELFEAKKMWGAKSRKETRLKTSNANLPEYLLNKVDYPSIFDYTGVLDEELSVQQLHKSQSSPNLQVISYNSAVASCLPKSIQNRSSSQSRQITVKNELFKEKTPQVISSKVGSKQDNTLIKGSLKKISTLVNLFDIESKKKSKELRKGKRVSIDRDSQTQQKQRLVIKSRIATKRNENGKKVK